MSSRVGPGLPANVEARMRLHFELSEFLFHEAALLDAGDFEAWLALMADDIHYWMPIRRTTTAAEADQAFTQIGDMAYFDDDKRMLKVRVAKMGAGGAWSEDPPSRTRHEITNVRLVHQDEVTVESYFHLYRTRLESEEDSWRGRRRDVLRRGDGDWQVVKRYLYLDQTVILAQNMSNLF